MRIEIKDEFIKLDSLLKFSGIVSTGGEAKMLITEGKVKVNDQICLMRGKKIRPEDKVFVLNKEITVFYENK